MSEIRGVLTAMVTPFDPDGAVDIDASRRLARHLVDGGSHGLVLAGTTGESATLSDDEKVRLLDAVLEEVGGEATVIAGTGSNDTRHAVSLTRKARDVGAHAVLSVTPYYNKPNEAGLRAHYAAVSDAAGDTPVVLYNIPSRSAINISPQLLAELAASHPNIVAVKQANDDELGPIEGMAILAGNDDVFARTLGFGGAGGILVASNVDSPRLRELYDAAVSGDADRVAELDATLKPLYGVMTVAPPAVSAKTALELLGVIEANVRLPMVPASAEEREAIRSELADQGLLTASAAS
ncbi:MAG: 4-hydroxy-tetrahydrodipicolinate synthase [Solirubrobacterales bacterium]|jgi:4-hydroxy-tetrahydrodipicolinate synthase|nr:4-hydroxy-tetrahydrodipicolinate synthase [Solirubrobacterales bacterium]